MRDCALYFRNNPLLHVITLCYKNKIFSKSLKAKSVKTAFRGKKTSYTIQGSINILFQDWKVNKRNAEKMQKFFGRRYYLFSSFVLFNRRYLYLLSTFVFTIDICIYCRLRWSWCRCKYECHNLIVLRQSRHHSCVHVNEPEKPFYTGKCVTWYESEQPKALCYSATSRAQQRKATL